MKSLDCSKRRDQNSRYSYHQPVLVLGLQGARSLKTAAIAGLRSVSSNVGAPNAYDGRLRDFFEVTWYELAQSTDATGQDPRIVMSFKVRVHEISCATRTAKRMQRRL